MALDVQQVADAVLQFKVWARQSSPRYMDFPLPPRVLRRLLPWERID